MLSDGANEMSRETIAAIQTLNEKNLAQSGSQVAPRSESSAQEIRKRLLETLRAKTDQAILKFNEQIQSLPLEPESSPDFASSLEELKSKVTSLRQDCLKIASQTAPDQNVEELLQRFSADLRQAIRDDLEQIYARNAYLETSDNRPTEELNPQDLPPSLYADEIRQLLEGFSKRFTLLLADAQKPTDTGELAGVVAKLTELSELVRRSQSSADSGGLKQFEQDLEEAYAAQSAQTSAALNQIHAKISEFEVQIQEQLSSQLPNDQVLQAISDLKETFCSAATTTTLPTATSGVESQDHSTLLGALRGIEEGIKHSVSQNLDAAVKSLIERLPEVNLSSEDTRATITDSASATPEADNSQVIDVVRSLVESNTIPDSVLKLPELVKNLRKDFSLLVHTINNYLEESRDLPDRVAEAVMQASNQTAGGESERLEQLCQLMEHQLEKLSDLNSSH